MISCIAMSETSIRIGAERKAGTTNSRFVPCRRFPEQDQNMRHFFRTINVERTVDSEDKALQIFNLVLAGSEHPGTHSGHLKTGEKGPLDSRKRDWADPTAGPKRVGKNKISDHAVNGIAGTQPRVHHTAARNILALKISQ